MKLSLIVGGLVLALVVVVLVVGWMLPVKHRASRSATFPATADQVWRLITDVDAFPGWRSDVKSVTRLADRDGHVVWVEEGSNGTNEDGSRTVAKPHTDSSRASPIRSCPLAAPGPM